MLDDGSGRLFLSDQKGFVKIFFMNGTVIDKPFLNISDRMVKLDPTYDERGLLSIAFHPNYTTNGRVFVYYSAPRRAGRTICEWPLAPLPPGAARWTATAPGSATTT